MKGVFKLYDKDKSGCMSMLELRQALNSAGYRVNYGILSLLARRYGNKKGKISYKDFLLCAIRLKVMIDMFQKNVSGDSDTLTFTMNQWLEKTLYI
uniref:EF-hand domain-containing protein n=1 Tax=Timema bartmani TaxID=61472 RepID=A0A7R9ENX9_9NEOP|nr:unnamed protein product [Timema bartmani]